MNLAQITTNIEQYLESTEATFVSSIPQFIINAEQRIFNEVELPYFRKNVTNLTFTANSPYLTLPADWLAMNSLAVVTPGGSTQTYLLPKDVEYVREMYPDPTQTGTPKYYGLYDVSTIILGPTPDQLYSTEMHYFYYPISITDTVLNPTGVTWLGTNYGYVLFYGALREAALFQQQEKDIVDSIEKLYQESKNDLVIQAKGKLRRDTYRNMQARMNPT